MLCCRQGCPPCTQKVVASHPEQANIPARGSNPAISPSKIKMSQGSSAMLHQTHLAVNKPSLIITPCGIARGSRIPLTAFIVVLRHKVTLPIHGSQGQSHTRRGVRPWSGVKSWGSRELSHGLSFLFNLEPQPLSKFYDQFPPNLWIVGHLKYTVQLTGRTLIQCRKDLRSCR